MFYFVIAKFYAPYIYNLNENEKHPHVLGKIKSNLNLELSKTYIYIENTSYNYFYLEKEILMTRKEFNPADQIVFNFTLRTKNTMFNDPLYSVVLYSPNKCNLTYRFLEDVFSSNCLHLQSRRNDAAFYIKLVVTLLPHTVVIKRKGLATGDEFLVIVNYGSLTKNVSIYYDNSRLTYWFLLRYNCTVDCESQTDKLSADVKVYYKLTNELQIVTSNVTRLGSNFTYSNACVKIIKEFEKRRSRDSSYHCEEDGIIDLIITGRGKCIYKSNFHSLKF